MSLRLVSPIKAFADGIVAVAIAVVLMFGLANTPRAVAADERLQFTATTLSGAPLRWRKPARQAGGVVVLDAVVPVLQRRSPPASAR